MTAHTPRVLTEGETSLIEAFEASGLTGADREAAMASLKETGLPTRRVEAFHYTDLRALLKAGYSVPVHAEEVHHMAPSCSGLATVLSGTTRHIPPTTL